MNINMKKVLLVLITVIVLISCTKDESGNIVLPSMNALIDGEQWNTLSRATVLENDKFIITGASIAGKTLVITIFGTSEGLYELNLPLSNNAGAVYKESASTTTEDAYVSVAGEVNLTSVDTSKKRISGTFNFIVTRNVINTINITEGTFSNLLYNVTSGGD